MTAPSPSKTTPAGGKPRRSNLAFFIAVIVLAGGAVSLQAVVRMNKWVLTKQPIGLRAPLTTIPDAFGPLGEDFRPRFRIVKDADGKVIGKEPRLPADAEDALGTTQYIAWQYRDHTKSKDEPGAFIRIHVPYYTGTIDTVPHVPERCFVAGGATPTDKRVIRVPLVSPQILGSGGDDAPVTARTAMARTVTLPTDRVPVTFVTFQHENRELDAYHVGYFFAANGGFEASPDGVRLLAFNLFDTHAYWAKVEVMAYQVVTTKMGERGLVPARVGVEETSRIVGEFLSYALPEVMWCLPDWDAVRAGKIDSANGSGDQG